MPEERIKITPAKGRPMLRWVGKKPLDYVKGFPAQLIEVFDPLNTGQKIETPTYDTLKDNWQNLLFHGDNKEVMATLIENGFRGEIDLIYIDPPFKSGADYIRKVELRGLKNLGRIEEDDASVLQQTMYFDIWNNDAYLQFMYERLILLKELLSDTGSIYVHMDWHVGHYVKLLMDEVFGQENFRNEIIVRRVRKNVSEYETVKSLNTDQDIVLFYSKSNQHRIKPPTIDSGAMQPRWHSFEASGYRKGMDYELFGYKPATVNHWRWSYEKAMKAIKDGTLRPNPETGKPEYLVTKAGVIIGSLWHDIQAYSFDTGLLTQKNESLLHRILEMSSESCALVLDCFIGSGTTAAMAQKLGRRWIACDINKGAIQMTSKRLQKIILDQIKKDKKAKHQELPRYYSFGVYQVNNYDLQLLKTEAVELATQHIGIQRIRTDTFFDGTLGKSLVKIIDFNHPLTLLDLQLIQDELSKRPSEDRDITIVCLGKELAIDPQIEEWNKKHPVNKLRIIELKTDKKYGHFLVHKPAEAKVAIQRVSKNKAVVEIRDFISPTTVERLNINSGLLKVKIPDFRCMIDTVLIDTDYDGKTFHIIYSDVPEKKDDLVKGKYEIELPNQKAKVAIKIIDMLGEEVLLEVAK
jgi:DNA modification methylase